MVSYLLHFKVTHGSKSFNRSLSRAALARDSRRRIRRSCHARIKCRMTDCAWLGFFSHCDVCFGCITRADSDRPALRNNPTLTALTGCLIALGLLQCAFRRFQLIHYLNRRHWVASCLNLLTFFCLPCRPSVPLRSSPPAEMPTTVLEHFCFFFCIQPLFHTVGLA